MSAINYHAPLPQAIEVLPKIQLSLKNNEVISNQPNLMLFWSFLCDEQTRVGTFSWSIKTRGISEADEKERLRFHGLRSSSWLVCSITLASLIVQWEFEFSQNGINFPRLTIVIWVSESGFNMWIPIAVLTVILFLSLLVLSLLFFTR